MHLEAWQCNCQPSIDCQTSKLSHTHAHNASVSFIVYCEAALMLETCLPLLKGQRLVVQLTIQHLSWQLLEGLELPAWQCQ